MGLWVLVLGQESNLPAVKDGHAHWLALGERGRVDQLQAVRQPALTSFRVFVESISCRPRTPSKHMAAAQ